MIRLGVLTLQFHSWWRTSSGQTNGDEIDDMIQRSPEGLPWLPGRTVKGLLRDASLQLFALGHMQRDEVVRVFGQHVDDIDKGGPDARYLDARYLTEPGTIRLGSAEMTEAWVAWAQVHPDDMEARAIIEALFDRRAMTAVNTNGVAKTGSLRAVEVAAPLTLAAPVWAEADAEQTTLIIEHAARFIKALGAGRNRGFGRVSIQFEGDRGTVQ